MGSSAATGGIDGHSAALRVPLAAALIVALSLLAWAALATWSVGPYGRYLDHGRWTDLPLLGELCRSLPHGDLLAAATFHAGAWLLMIAAMMLPTVLPLINVMIRAVAARKDAAAVVGLVVTGYAIVWSGFGVAAFTLDALVRTAAAQSAWFASNGDLLGATVLAVAGGFQFSSLKYRCLDRCRSPFGFVTQHWRGRRPMLDGLHIGLAHGAFCVGCCWALMLVMFVVGMGNLGWMLLLATLMAVEKNLPFGRRVAAPVGLALIAAAAVLALGGR